MKNCREIRIHIKDEKIWVEYDLKTRTNRIDCIGIADATAIAHTLYANVENWIEEAAKKEEK